MSLDDEFLSYPNRRYGMDHDRYAWSMLSERPAVQWPEKKRLAIWINVSLQFFPLNQSGKPFKVPYGMSMPYPDLRHFTLRDYGNRVGIYRILDALDSAKLTPTFAINTRLAERNPYLMHALRERGNELLCHGYHMDALHFGGQDQQQELDSIRQSLDSLRELSRQEIRGWISPARSESDNTPDLLTTAGISYFCDWVNDDMPYYFNTKHRPLVAMPLPTELEDAFILQSNLHSEQSYVDQVCDAFDYLYGEAQREGGRILALNIHPWLLGQPHRIAKFEAILAHIQAHGGVWSASASEIEKIFRQQTEIDLKR